VSDILGLIAFRHSREKMFRCLDEICDRLDVLWLNYLYRHQDESWARAELDRERREIQRQLREMSENLKRLGIDPHKT
jgi:hypothetical protein